MKKNMGLVDRLIRTVVAIVIAVLYFAHVIDGTLALILGIVALIFLLTGVVSFCPIYALLGLKTCAEEPTPAPPAAPKA